MNGYDALVGLPSPPHSASYIYNEPEAYLDSSHTSSTGSPMESPYDLTYSGIYASPENIEGTAENTQSEPQPSSTKPAAKRKRENRYKNAPPSVLSRRRAQNRASQRAYRERKDQRIKDLEVLLGEAQRKNDVLSQAYASLQAEYIKLKSEQETSTYHHHHHQAPPPGLPYDPTIGAPTGAEMEMFIYGDGSSYTM
ncbi:hypothetical protein F4778DRAFT_782254 [Xylariomycetidae sp. FL2044]|nr:hypothetical protein F4778DRAFT_782254 [Xylariomycetidae sp. FL2044]